MGESPSFRIDAKSLAQAQFLASELQESHLTTIDELRTARESHAISDLIRPLAEISKEVPLLDISTDVEDFGLLVYLATFFQDGVAALPMGTREKRVPILPSRETLTCVLQAPTLPATIPEFAPAGAVQVTIDEARETFFQGLSSYLAARIAGVRAGLGTNAGTGSPGQWWTAATQGSGLSMYLAGTHAVHLPPTYINGVTKPLPLLSMFLPMGTLHLGADAGPGGNIIWDPSVITVPSPTPTFNTKRF